MSNAFDKASLVMLPHAYEEGKLYSLKPTDRSGDFTFSRGTDTATRVNEQGYIEKETVNLLLQSNNFDTTWANSGTTETGGQADKDGGSTAWLLGKSVANGYIYQNITQGGVQTFSVYLKAGTLTWSNLIITGSGSDKYAYLNLSNGTFGSTGAGNIDTQVESVGNGWYRCSIAVNSDVTRVRIYPADGDLDTSGTSGNIYIQDAQLNYGLVAQPYLETTTAPVYGGLTDNMPRLDYSGGATCPSLLLEPSRTNLMPYSEYFGAGWGSNDTTLTYNTDTSPEGVQNATTIADTSGSVAQEIRYNPTLTAGASYAFSIFIKKDTDTTRFPEFFFRIYSGGTEQAVAVQINTQTGAKNERYQQGSAVSDVIDFNDNYWRLVITATDPNDGNTAFRIYLRPAAATTLGAFEASATGSIVVYGAQLELGSYPTSYIPTYGSTQTRAVDNCHLINSTSLPTAYPFTLFADVTLTDSMSDEPRFISFIGDLSSQYYTIAYSSNISSFRIFYRNVGSVNVLDSSNYSLGNHKVAAIFTETEVKLFVDGNNEGNVTNNILFSSAFDNLILGQLRIVGDTNTRSPLNQALVFPTALSDDECIALTTIV